ncbi:MAG: hypothetical protein H7Z37_13935, partial [Pyrinomonadaceae bacterium]|nr:hypothetical protein [Pyrinomonadaceae bacterium]
MIFDKEKIRRTAEKNLSNGRLQAAIKDYCQIVDRDPRDYNTLNTLGDLYARVESFDDAVKCFTKIAEHYNAQGFAHKAIAMYKKVLRLKPNAIESAAKLAPLYQSLGLIAEARNHYLMVADDLIRRDRRDKALEVWVRIADLDPNDTQTRLKVAESYLESDQKAEAAEAFGEAGSRLLAKRQYEEAVKAFNTVLSIRINDIAALSGLTTACIELETPDEVIYKLEEAVRLQPENSELLSLLAQCHIEMKSAEAAEESTNRLVAREPSSYKRHLEIVALYLHQKREQDATRVLNYCAEMLLSNGQEDELELWANKILARDQEQLVALRMIARLRAWQRQEDNLKIALERLVEAAHWKNAVDEERGALKELIQLFPEDERYLSRFTELGEHRDDDSETFAPVEKVPMFETFSSFHDSNQAANENVSAEDFAKPDYVNNQTEVFSWSENPENDFSQTLETKNNNDWDDVNEQSNPMESQESFESKTEIKNWSKDENPSAVKTANTSEVESYEAKDNLHDEIVLSETVPKEVAVVENDYSRVHDFTSSGSDATVADFNSNFSNPPEQTFEFEISQNDETLFGQKDVNQFGVETFGVETNDDSNIQIESSGKTTEKSETVDSFDDSEFRFVNASTETFKTVEESSSEDLTASIQAHLQQELESVDFYILQEYHDLATETLNLLHIQFGDQPEIQSRLEKLQESRGKTLPIHKTADPEIEKSNQQSTLAAIFETPQIAADETQIETYDATPDNNAITTVNNVSEPESPSEITKTEQLETTGNAKNSDDWNWDDEIQLNLDNASELPLAKTEVETKLQEKHVETVETEIPETPKPAETLKSSADYDDLFADFGDDVEVANLPFVQTADFETHYNLGLAYKEMSLMDDAVEEFQTAIKMIDAKDGTPRYLQCC